MTTTALFLSYMCVLAFVLGVAFDQNVIGSVNLNTSFNDKAFWFGRAYWQDGNYSQYNGPGNGLWIIIGYMSGDSGIQVGIGGLNFEMSIYVRQTANTGSSWSSWTKI